MSDTLLAATLAMADMLAAENAALATLDLPAAATLLNAKRQATAAFSHAHAEAAGPRGSAMMAAAARLRAAAEENRRLLERAIDVQGRVIGLFARAIPRAAAQGQARYGADGGLRPARARAVSLSRGA